MEGKFKIYLEIHMFSLDGKSIGVSLTHPLEITLQNGSRIGSIPQLKNTIYPATQNIGWNRQR